MGWSSGKNKDINSTTVHSNTIIAAADKAIEDKDCTAPTDEGQTFAENRLAFQWEELQH